MKSKCRVLVRMEWEIIGIDELIDYFYRVVEMPCVPSVGTVMMFIDPNDSWGCLFETEFVVEKHEWDERCREWIEVVLKKEVFDGTEQELKEEMTQAGWTQADKPREVTTPSTAEPPAVQDQHRESCPRPDRPAPGQSLETDT